MKTTDPEQKRAVYIKVVSDYARLWQHRDSLLTQRHTWQLIIIFAAVHFTDFLYLTVDYFSRPVLADQLQKFLPQLKEIIPEAGEAGIDVQETFRTLLLDYSAGYTFLQNAITILLSLLIMRMIVRRRTGTSLPVGSLNLFRLPEVAIFIFIAACLLPLASFYIQVPHIPYLISVNLAIFMAILYVFNGLGIFSIFLEVRLLPSNWIFMGLMLLSIFIPYLMLAFVGTMLSVGLGDFFFNFRKRALHPVPPPV